MLPLIPQEPVDGPARRMIEDAIVFALQGLKLPALGGDTDGYVQAIEAYQGETDPTAEDRDLNRVSNGRFPAILVTTGEATYEEYGVSREVITYELEVIVLLAVDNGRSAEAKARGGIDTDPGVYQLMHDVHETLWGADLNIAGAGRLTPGSEQVLARSQQKALWSITYRIKIDLDTVIGTNVDEYSSILHKTNNADDDTADPIVQGLITLE